MLTPISPLIIVLIPPATQISSDHFDPSSSISSDVLQLLQVDEEMLDAALARRGVDLKTTPINFQVHAENTPLHLWGFDSRVLTVPLDEVRRAQPNWTVEGGR
jgi:hypothetical protein